MNPGPWRESPFTPPTWRERLLCALLGHRISNGHPRVQDCERCHQYRWRDRKMDPDISKR